MEFTVIPKNDLAELFSPEEIAEIDFPYPVYESNSKEFSDLLESSNWNSNNE